RHTRSTRDWSSDVCSSDLILVDDALTRGLGDAEARILVEWLVEQAETFAETSANEPTADIRIRTLCRRGRAIGRFVGLWCHSQEIGRASCREGVGVLW